MLPTTQRNTPNSKVRASMSWLPSPEYADWWYDLSWKGIITFGAVAAFATAATVMFTVLQFWSDGIRDERSDARQLVLESETSSAKAEASRANESAAVLEKEAAALKAQAEADRLARVKIERQMAPRSITQEQQHELTARLTKHPKQTVAVIAAPSTAESEWFARVLGAPIKEAGWETEVLGGASTAMFLHPRGVIVQFRLSNPDGNAANAALELANALNEFGVLASAVPGPMELPGLMADKFTIIVVISEK